MGDVAALITAIAGLVTACTGLVGVTVVLIRLSRRERPRAARNVVAELAEAAEDGVITVEELRRIATPPDHDQKGGQEGDQKGQERP